ncbi:MAG: DEAD/DEAH box helicase [Desulfosalsimonas sp.]|uniref:DEAD/DEAH box helicase n=1 Tax=Desulfosalsimonas sp. TaxID=3073848 RepID=UPI0039709024
MTAEDLFAYLPAHRLEHHRNALALVPEKNDPDPGVAVFLMDPKTGYHTLTCSCKAAAGKKRKSRCPHIKQLSEALRKVPDPASRSWLDTFFRKTPWYETAAALHQACPVSSGSLKISPDTSSDTGEIRVWGPDTELLAAFSPDPEDSEKAALEKQLLLERTNLCPQKDNPFHRGRVMDMLARLTLTETERLMALQEVINRRQALEQSFWFRLLYHFRNVSADAGPGLATELEQETGRYIIACTDRSRALRIVVPRKGVMRVQKQLQNIFPGTGQVVWPESLESIVKVSADENNYLRLTLCLLLHLPDGATEAIERSRLKKYWYGDAVYIPDKNVLATWKATDRFGPVFGRQYTKRIKPERVPEIIDKMGDIFSPPNIIDPSAKRLRLHRQWDRMEIAAEAVDRDWCWLAVSYGFGENVTVRLADIYAARRAGKKYLPVDDGWVEIRDLDLGPVVKLPGSPVSAQLADGRKTLQLSRMDLLRIQAASGGNLRVRPQGDAPSKSLSAILDMQPATPVTRPAGMATGLRGYQENGLQWLSFLAENRMGGLLCDEMGLGKTHQVMALMAWLAENRQKPAPCLVVCPTTVISHWERKIREHAPGLQASVYYGAGREMADLSVPGMVMITSYGILLRDAAVLQGIGFAAAAFDEAHLIKNPDTKSHAAAHAIRADLKIAVTGTPVENRLTDLKALMDLVLPGCLGTDQEFARRYENAGRHRRKELQRLIRPFTLRRTKDAVLHELPEKIEDIRYCRLTDTQVRLYRDAVAGRGKKLQQQLARGDADIPYIHIFALLSLLKQICNHPASVDRGSVPKNFKTDQAAMDSGKWELFVELLDACLQNGQKVVVFSQFLPMIRMIIAHLQSIGVESAGITGQTRARGRQIDRFNNDPECRVFVGSLRAGGSGIDLTGGSVVIHYDRWWNAAKEDQATDRVHRIGQNRGVQVFKLVTEGTLEEKISAIIDRKKNLMADVIAEDDPGLLKTFSRDELMDLISLPE